MRAGFFVMLAAESSAAGCNRRLSGAEFKRESDCQAKPRPMSEAVRDLGIDRGRMVRDRLAVVSAS